MLNVNESQNVHNYHVYNVNKVSSAIKEFKMVYDYNDRVLESTI